MLPTMRSHESDRSTTDVTSGRPDRTGQPPGSGSAAAPAADVMGIAGRSQPRRLLVKRDRPNHPVGRSKDRPETPWPAGWPEFGRLLHQRQYRPDIAPGSAPVAVKRGLGRRRGRRRTARSCLARGGNTLVRDRRSQGWPAFRSGTHRPRPHIPGITVSGRPRYARSCVTNARPQGCR